MAEENKRRGHTICNLNNSVGEGVTKNRRAYCQPGLFMALELLFLNSLMTNGPIYCVGLVSDIWTREERQARNNQDQP